MNSLKLAASQLEIIRYLYRFRFLNSRQLQKLLKQSSIRLTNYHLRLLFRQNYIARHYSRSLGPGNTPAVYFLAPASLAIIKDLPGVGDRTIKCIYQERIRSQRFIAHVSYIADYYLFLRESSEKTHQTLHFFTKADLAAHPYFIHPLPDVYFALLDGKNKTKRYMLEIVDDTLPRFAIRRRIEQYSDYAESGEFEDATKHPFPTLLFVCYGPASLIYLKKYLNRIYEETSLDLSKTYLSTREGALSGRWERAEMEEE